MAKEYLENVSFLVVEDNAFMRRIVKALLRALGATKINEAPDGAGALKVMKTAVPDVILVDWEMQPLDGIEFVKLVRRSPDSPNPYIPIIMLSGHSEQRRVMEARDAGVNEFAVKPISARTLWSRVQAVIERPRPFVRTRLYFGPDRRRRQVPFQGPDRRQSPPSLIDVPPFRFVDSSPADPEPATGRRAPPDALLAAPAGAEKTMDQGAVDSLFDTPVKKAMD